MPRPPLRRSRLKTRIAAAHATVRVLEQELRAASSAHWPWDKAIWRRARHTLVGRVQVFRVNLEAFQVYPGFARSGLMSSKFMAPDHTASKSEPGSVRGLS